MSRPLRIQFPDAWHHVMNRGRRREVVFSSKKDYLSFIEILKETSRLLNIRIVAFCLLPNHYHLLVQTPEGNLSRCMRHINGVYTQRFNRRNGHDGPLFRGRYKSILIDSDNYLTGLVRYIHRNPIRAGLTNDLNQYTWSSHQGYLVSSKKWEWIYKKCFFALLSPDKLKQFKEYKAFISEEDSKEILGYYRKKNFPSIIGSEKFTNRVKEKIREFAFKEEIPESKLLAPDADKIRNIVSKVYKMKQESLYGIKRGIYNEPRNVAIFLTRQLRRDSLKAVGKEYKIDNYSSVSSIVENMKKRIKGNKKLKNSIDQIIKGLS